MVMHARKHPRIDDGYADKREAQSYQSSQNPSKTGYNRHRSPSSRDSPSSRGHPRYSNKSSYNDRLKEKYETRGTESSPGKRSNHSYAGGSSNNGQDKNRTSSNSKDKNEVQKSAIRTCGEWSEHLSSQGKKYYYNLKTEQSQWEKPRDWSDSLAGRPNRPSTDSRSNSDKHNSKDGKNRHSSGGIEKREKHLGDLKHMVVDGNPKPDKMYLFEKLQQSQSKMQAERRGGGKHLSDVVTDSRNDDSYSSDYHNSRQSSRQRRDSDAGRNSSRQTSRNDCDDLESPGSTPTSHLSGGTPLCNNPNMAAAANLNFSNLPNLLSELSGASQNNQELTSKALQTLQKLQQALTRQIAAHQTSVSNQTSSNSGLIQASPHHQIGHHDDVSSLQQVHPSHSIHYHQHSPHGLSAVQGSAGLMLSNTSGASVQHVPNAGSHMPGHPHSSHSSQQQQHHHHHRSPYINNNSHPHSSSHHQSNSALAHPQSSPMSVVSMAPGATVQTTTSPMTTGSTTIPITHTGNHVHRGNTVYGKFLGAQQVSASSYSHPMEELGPGDHRGLEGGGQAEDRSSCNSPTPSDTSSQGAPVDPDMFTGTNIGQKENNLMSTLSQYYKEQSVAHVAGWQGELVEKQARLYHDESLRIGSMISSQVSVELKRARSLVRVEEIQSTLLEQRNLFLAQQIAELENMKPVSSVSLFVPSSTSTAAQATNNT